MKKNFLMFAVVAAAFSLSACSNDDQENIVLNPEKENTVVTPDQNSVQITFSAGMSNGATSKTSISETDNHKLEFAAGDQIIIIDSKGEKASATAVLPDGKQTSPTCTFTANFSAGSEGPYKAYYPASAFGDTKSIPTSQTAENGTFDPNAHIMSATADNQEFNFQTRNSFFKFTAPCNLSQATLTTKGEKIAGEFIMDTDDKISATDGGQTSITLSGTMEKGKTYYFSLIPTSFAAESVVLTLTSTSGEDKTYTVNNTFEAHANKVSTFSKIADLFVNKIKCSDLETFLGTCPDEVTICLEDYNGTNLDNDCLQNTSKKVHLVLPKGLTGIVDYAFDECGSIVSIKIPNGVTSIGEAAFAECTGLTGNVEIPDGVTSIGVSAFEDCSEITGISIPKSVTTLKKSFIDGCTNLTDLSIDMEEIPAEAFSGRSNITNLTIGPNVKTIGNGAFFECTGLTGNVEIPDGVTSIREYAFGDCSEITGISIPKSVSTLKRSFIDGCTKLTDLSIDMENIPDNAFYGRSSITNVTIGPNVKTIGGNAFNGCSLTTLTIPNSVENIYYDTFEGLPSTCEIHVTAKLKSGYSKLYHFDITIFNQMIDDVPEN